MAGFSISRRMLAFTAALGLAAVATLSLTSYIQGVETRALRQMDAVEAYVAKDLIPQGTTGEAATAQGLIVRQPIPRGALAEGTIGSLGEIKDKIAAVNILKGEQILSERFVVETAAEGRLAIPEDRQAVSEELGIPPGVAGFVRAGDRVSVVAQLEVSGPAGAEPRVQYLLQGVQVLAVGQRIVVEGDARTEDQLQQRVLLTLALTPAEVEKLAFAMFNGQIYFTLLPPGQQPAGTPGRTRDSAFS